jgi:hypothetical protein
VNHCPLILLHEWDVPLLYKFVDGDLAKKVADVLIQHLLYRHQTLIYFSRY